MPDLVSQAAPTLDRDRPVNVDCRVAVLTHYLPPYMARVLVHLKQHVAELPILLSIDEEPNRQFGDTWEGLDVTVQKSLMLRRRWKHRAGFADELYVHFPYDTLSQLRRINPDIIFSYELGFRSLVSALYAKTFRKKLALCVCVSEHTENGRGAARHFLRRRLLKMADAVTYNGPSCRNYLQKFGVPNERLHHFPYACSDLFRYEGPLERTTEANHRLICIGQLSERKGIQPLLKSLSEYCTARPDRVVEIDFVGTGPLQRGMKKQQLPANLKMRLLGHLTYDRMCEAMEHTGALVFPTLADEWGLVVNEAMQAGLVVIGSQFAQASTTLIRDGENGWTYSPDQQEKLFANLDEFYGCDPNRLLKMRLCARETVAEITPQNVAAQASSMFAQILNGRNA